MMHYKKAPIASVNAIIIKIVNDIFLFLISCIAAIRAPKVSTSILVRTDSVTLRPVDKIKGVLLLQELSLPFHQ